MKTTATYHESYQPKQGFGARLLFYAFLLSLIGLSKAFAQAPSAPVATSATNVICTSFDANWGTVSGATNYFLDVSTESTFSSFVTGYSNLNVGNVTSFNVNGLNSGLFYYRLRAQDINGTSLNSNTISVLVGDAHFFYPSAPYCLNSSNAIPEFYGVLGGTFFATPAGLIINPSTGEINFTASAVGVYTVSYTDNLGCPDTSFTSITINQNCSLTYIISPIDGATINSACDLNFCIHNDNNYSGEPYIYDSIGTWLSYGSIGTPIDSLCLINVTYASYSYAAGYHTFYLHDNFVITDSVTLYFPNPIASFQNQLTFTETPTTNGGYDFTVSGFSPTETYTMVLYNNYNNQYDTLLVNNTTTATISHQYPYNSNFYGDLYVTGGCNGSTAHDSVEVSVINSACSSFIDLASYFFIGSNCGSAPAIFAGTVYYENLSTNDSSQITINWGDGTVQTLQIQHDTSGIYQIPTLSHQYLAPGTYTTFATVNNPNACYLDTLIQPITIGSYACGNLLGAIYSDVNTNCALDNGTDVGLGSLLITATDNNSNVFYAWTDFNGNYGFNALPNGTYVVDFANLNAGYSLTCSNVFPQTVVINNNSLVADCPVTCNGSFDAAITGISIWSALYPGQPEMILPHVGLLNGACNTTVVAGQVKIVLDACTQYTSPSTYSTAGAPDAIITAATGDTLVWNVADINNIGNFSYYDYAINILMCTTAQVGDSACITMIVEPLTGDADPTNNTFTRCFEIGVSYDPNNKEVMPTGVEAAGFIPADQPSLTYTLNFQNTGTAKAFNIYVMDTIDTDLDINSIEILSASHKLQVYTLPNRAIKFMFADIMLPDSTHDEPNSHGYVTFKIKMNQGLTPGTEIENTGHIYFDYNEAIVTNTTLNTIEFPSSVQSIGKSSVVKVFPNPAKESVTVVSTSNSAGTITITDLLGKTVKEITTTNEKTVVNTSDLQSGVYFIKLTQNNVSKTEKIMIAK